MIIVIMRCFSEEILFLSFIVYRLCIFHKHFLTKENSSFFYSKEKAKEEKRKEKRKAFMVEH